MKVLVSTSLPKLVAFESAHLGRLFTPRMTGNIRGTVGRGMPFAADNDCFNGLDEVALLKLAELVRDQDPGGQHLFFAVPDKPMDAAETRRLWRIWAPRLRAYGLNLAYVCQNGETAATVPWADCDAVFIAGDTRWKLGVGARAIIREAKARRKHVHMGRVNTLGRMRYAFRVGVDSVDGSALAKWTNKKLPAVIRLLDRLQGARTAPHVRRLDSFSPESTVEESTVTTTSTTTTKQHERTPAPRGTW